jgi:membrane associated rhomboid family serine protease
MLLPWSVDVPMRRVPLANWVLIAATCAVSLAVLFGGGRSDAVTALALHKRGFTFTQLFTHALVHADLWHLVGNMWFLFCFGNAVNAKVGHAVYLALYFFLGAVAGIAWVALGQGAAMIGASGAIMGVVGLFVVYFPNNDVEVWYWFGWVYAGMGRVPSWVVVAFWMLLDLVGTVVQGDGIAYVAHLAGGVGGVGLGVAMVAARMFESEPGEENLLQLLGYHENEDRERRRVRHRWEE